MNERLKKRKSEVWGQDSVWTQPTTAAPQQRREMLLLQAVRVGTAALVRHCPRGLLALSTPFFAYHACPVMVLLVITAVRVYLEVSVS